MQEHVSRTARACFSHPATTNSPPGARSSSDRPTCVNVSTVASIDYCNAVLASLPASTLAPLQRVLNAAARLVLELGPRDHVSAALRELHWLPIRKRIDLSYVCWLTTSGLVARQSICQSFSRPRRTILQRRHNARQTAATSSFLRRGFDSVIAPSL